MKPPPRSFAAPPPSPPAADAKAALRRELRTRRRRLHAAAPAAGERLVAGFEAAGLPAPAIAAAYLATGSELDPGPLTAWLQARGARLALPVVAQRGAPLRFRAVEGGLDGRDALGLAAPGADAPELRPDLVLVPLLAFDRRGGRLGQGGGYYDRTLEALRRAGPPVLAIGLAFAGQEVETLPQEPTDQPLDGVLTEVAYLPLP